MALFCRMAVFAAPLLLAGCGMGLDEPSFQAPLFRGLMILGDTILGWTFWAMLFFWVLFSGRLFKGYGPNWSVFLVAMFSSFSFWVPLLLALLFLKPAGYLTAFFGFRYPLYSIMMLAGQILPVFLAFSLLFYFFSRPSLRLVRRCGRKGDVERLINFTRSTEYRIQQEAVLALADIPRDNPSLVDRTYRFLRNLLDFRAELKEEAADTLLALGPAMIPLIMKDLADEDPLAGGRLIRLLHKIDSLKAYEFITGYAGSEPETAIRAGNLAGELFPDRADEWVGFMKDKNSSRSLFGRRALLVVGDDHSLTLVRRYDAKSSRLTVAVRTAREEWVEDNGLKTVIEKQGWQYFYDGKEISPVAGKKCLLKE